MDLIPVIRFVSLTLLTVAAGALSLIAGGREDGVVCLLAAGVHWFGIWWIVRKELPVIAFQPKPEPDRSDWWPCACMKRDRKGNMTHIRLNSPKRKKCRACGMTKQDHDDLAAKEGA